MDFIWNIKTANSLEIDLKEKTTAEEIKAKIKEREEFTKVKVDIINAHLPKIPDVKNKLEMTDELSGLIKEVAEEFGIIWTTLQKWRGAK